MSDIIRLMKKSDSKEVMEMMREFYSSAAVFTSGSDEIFDADIENCTNENPFVEGYILEDEGVIQGYAMVAKSFSTEFGKTCIWIEDLYIKEGFRKKGLGKTFMDFIINKYTDCVFRLDVEEENEAAVKFYKNFGFGFLPYMEMKR